ncbi:MAG: hypothetical protein QXU98_04170 [Candidatus Parvarchaeota archaeon]
MAIQFNDTKPDNESEQQFKNDYKSTIENNENENQENENQEMPNINSLSEFVNLVFDTINVISKDKISKLNNEEFEFIKKHTQRMDSKYADTTTNLISPEFEAIGSIFVVSLKRIREYIALHRPQRKYEAEYTTDKHENEDKPF